MNTEKQLPSGIDNNCPYVTDSNEKYFEDWKAGRMAPDDVERCKHKLAYRLC
ncbi:hypothetical protein ACQH80_16125 [Escherichia coli]|uniref:hypothetical protein n=1 Tax=Escherichia coli TaxID=562 RepID=UPI003CFB4A15